MRTVGAVLIAISLVLGGMAVWGLRSISGAHAAEPRATAQTLIVVAAKPIAVGEALAPEALRLQPWPAEAQPPGSMHTVAEAIAGSRIALSAISPNEPILKSRISGPGARPTLSGTIRPGMRATSMRIDDVMGVAGFVLPGDFVDVLLTRPDGGEGTLRTDVLLQGVRVLAVDQLASENKNDPVLAKAATVELTAEQAQKLALARQVGTVSLTLRGTADPIEAAATRTVRMADLGGAPNRPIVLPGAAGGPAPQAQPIRVADAKPARPRGPVMQIYRGAEPAVVAIRTE